MLERIYTDAWGPYRVSSITGDKYFFSFTDDHSKKSWVYMTNIRAKLHDMFTEVKVQVELETGARIKNVRCDNISEYKVLAAKYGKRITGFKLSLRQHIPQNKIVFRNV